jgi:hypothetical protein
MPGCETNIVPRGHCVCSGIEFKDCVRPSYENALPWSRTAANDEDTVISRSSDREVAASIDEWRQCSATRQIIRSSDSAGELLELLNQRRVSRSSAVCTAQSEEESIVID